MAKGFKIKVTGLGAWDNASDIVFGAVKDCMDDMRDDFLIVSASLAPHKTGVLDKSAKARRYYKNLDNCWFQVTFTANNPKDGFDYATWTHEKHYKLGKGSRAKRPIQGRFAKGALRVGTGYMQQVETASRASWTEFIDTNVKKKLRAELKKKSGK